jgi:hypothetical protein
MLYPHFLNCSYHLVWHVATPLHASPIQGWQFLPRAQVFAGTVPVWAGYGHIFVPMGKTRTRPVKSRVGHGYISIPAGIPVPCPFISDMWTRKNLLMQHKVKALKILNASTTWANTDSNPLVSLRSYGRRAKSQAPSRRPAARPPFPISPSMSDF